MTLPSAESIQIILPIISILFLMLSFKRPIYGVVSYFIILNAKLGDMYPTLGAIRFELIAAAIVFISIFLSGKGLRNALPSKNSLNKPLWILFVVGMLSVPQAVNVAVSWENGGYELLKVVLFYVMVVSSIHEYNDLKKLLWALALVAAWVAYEPVANYLSGRVLELSYGDVAYGRFGAASGHVGLANTLNQGIPLLYFWALGQREKRTKLILGTIIVLLIIGVLFTKSRGGFVGLITIGVGIIYFSKSRAKTLIILMIAFFLLLAYVGPGYLTHMSTIEEGVEGSRSAGDRYWGLLNGISMMIKRPILGVGIGCFAEARRQFFSYYFYSHNLYGELFGELGLASTAWFYWIYVIFKRTSKLKSGLGRDNARNKFYYNVLNGIQLGLFFRLIMGNFTHGAFIWFWFLMAALVFSIENISVGKPKMQEPMSLNR